MFLVPRSLRLREAKRAMGTRMFAVHDVFRSRFLDPLRSFINNNREVLAVLLSGNIGENYPLHILNR